MGTDRCNGETGRTLRWVSGRRHILRLGFGLIIALLAFSTLQAYRIQASLSEEALQIYHAHVKQDDLITRLRRTLWLGANLTRDYMVHPVPDVRARFDKELAELKRDSRQLLEMIYELSAPGLAAPELRSKTDEFWSVLDGAPDATAGMPPSARYRFIQREIVSRRNAVGDLVRQFSLLSQEALRESEREFASTRRNFANRLLLVLGVCLLFGIVVAGFSLVHAESLEKKTLSQYEEVQRANAELQQLSGRLMEVQEQERIQLARDLHDEIGQMVATVRLEVSQAESLPAYRFDEIRIRMARAKELAGRTVESVRNICLWLRPAMLDDLGLIPALQWQVEEFSRRTGIEVVFTEHQVDDNLPDSTRTCVYRVLQESLHNCEKHAGSTRVEVTISSHNGQILLEARDNGCGFTTDPRGMSRRPGRFGILGMRERALASGGTLTIESAPGEGTVVRLWVPAATANSELPLLEARAS
jgi:signal transduction histidine kinase